MHYRIGAPPQLHDAIWFYFWSRVFSARVFYSIAALVDDVAVFVWLQTIKSNLVCCHKKILKWEIEQMYYNHANDCSLCVLSSPFFIFPIRFCIVDNWAGASHLIVINSSKTWRTLPNRVNKTQTQGRRQQLACPHAHCTADRAFVCGRMPHSIKWF